MENDVFELLGDEPFAVDLDAVVTWIRLCSELSDHPSVDAHASIENELLGSPSRRDTRACNDLLEPLGVILHGPVLYEPTCGASRNHGVMS